MESRPLARQIIGGKDVFLVVFREPVEECSDLILVGGLPQTPAMVLRQDGRPLRARQHHQIVRMIHQPCDEMLLRRHVGEEPRLHGAEAHAVFRQHRVLPRIELQREDLREEIAGVAHLERDSLRFLVVAGDQAPQLAAAQDRDRHGGERPHVAHVFEMYRRDAAQHRVAEIQRRRITRLDRDGRVVGVGNDAQTVAPVEFPRLGGNIGSREPQVEVGGQHLVAVLGDDGAVPRVVEPVDQDPVEAGHAADVLRGQIEQELDGRRFLQLAHETAQGGIVRIDAGDRVGRRLLQFENRAIARAGDRRLEELFLPRRPDLDGPDEAGAAGRWRVIQLRGEFCAQSRQHLFERTAESIRRIESEGLGDVGAGIGDRPVGEPDREKDSVRLDAAWNVDRLPLAGGQIDVLRRLQGHGVSHSQSCITLKVSCAAPTMRSSASGDEASRSLAPNDFHMAATSRP
jgi:hypothetical protein